MRTEDFSYNLDSNLIAQSPNPLRDQCRMLVLNKENGDIEDKKFFQIYDYISSGDLLIANETRVLPARLLGTKRSTCGNAEILLLKRLDDEGDNVSYWEALVKPGKRLKLISTYGLDEHNSSSAGPIVDFYEGKNLVLSAQIIGWGSSKKSGLRKVKLMSQTHSVDKAIHIVGKTPLPPYIHNYQGDMEMYQTVYSKLENSAAAPTAGLHFTDNLINKIQEKGAMFKTIDLEVGIDTFKPVTVEDPKDHQIHTERYTISKDVVDCIEEAKQNGKKVIAIGTTSVRTLESAFNVEKHILQPHYCDSTSLYILPGYKFNVVDAMITNFHVPKSTLMMLVSAFAGYGNIMNAYSHALESKYKFLSFGDAMFIH